MMGIRYKRADKLIALYPGYGPRWVMHLWVQGGGDQVMLNVNWSGNYGPSHYDNGSIILYAAGENCFQILDTPIQKIARWTIHTASQIIRSLTH